MFPGILLVISGTFIDTGHVDHTVMIQQTSTSTIVVSLIRRYPSVVGKYPYVHCMSYVSLCYTGKYSRALSKSLAAKGCVDVSIHDCLLLLFRGDLPPQPSSPQSQA